MLAPGFGLAGLLGFYLFLRQFTNSHEIIETKKNEIENQTLIFFAAFVALRTFAVLAVI